MTVSALNWQVIYPVTLVAVAAMVILLLEVFLAPRKPTTVRGARGARRLGIVLAMLASAALALSLVTASVFLASNFDAYFDRSSGMLHMDALACFAVAVVSLGALFSIWLSSTYLMALDINHGEYYALLLLSVAGMFLSAAAEHLMLLFIGIELMSIPVYALAAFDGAKPRSNEAGLKYFLMGSFTSAIFLYGVALLYGATGRLDYPGLQNALVASDPLAMAGLALILVGLAFKLALAPFHQWAPDVYEGAPTPVAAFMAVCVKVTAAVIVLRFVLTAVPDLADVMRRIFWAFALLSLVIGNLMAVIQNNLKRMLAYSSIAHAGYLALALAAGTSEAQGALLFYLVVYLFMTLGAFGVVVALAAGGRDCERIADLGGLASRRPGMAAIMTLFMLSLAGVPGTAGFWAKFHVFSAAVGAGEVGLVIVAVLGSAVSLYYYMRIPVAMYMRRATDDVRLPPSTSEWAVLLACAAAVLYMGFFPNLHLPGLEGELLEVLQGWVGG